MPSLFELLGFQRSSSRTPPGAVQEIAARLERLGPERSRYVAAFAVVLSRVAQADLDISEPERAKMEEIVGKLGHLEPEEASMVVAIAVDHSLRSGGTEHFLATREFGERSDRSQREKLLSCLFELSAADGSISSAEENRIRQIASELGFTHREFAQARSRWNDVRDILK